MIASGYEGRVQDGQLGAIGTDGSFGDDGRFHPIPANSPVSAACGILDANGRLFITGGDSHVRASNWFAGPGTSRRVCP
jgi:hypothetical protein